MPAPRWFPCIVLSVLILIVIAARPATAQALITVNENVNFKLGALGQFQGEWLEDPVEDDTQQNLFIRRIRLMFGGQVAKNVTFFIETDAANLGKTTANGKNISPQMIVQDAYGELKLHDALALDLGLMFIPFSRQSVQSAATLLGLDYGSYTFGTSAATQSSVGRDTGVQAKGYLVGDRLEYRFGVFQGARDARSHNAFRYAGRVQVQLLDPEPRGFFYTGTYLGARRVGAVGAAFDRQDDYSAYDIDAFLDLPLGPGTLTTQVAYHSIDGETTFTTLPEQKVMFVEAGFLIHALKLTPVLQFTKREVAHAPDGDETRWNVGLNYWWAGHNANLKAAYGRIDPRGLKEQNQFTVQLQLFYY